MPQSDPISRITLEETVQHLKSSSCCLDILAAGSLKKILITWHQTLVDTSLLSGFSLQALKTAVIKPLQI